MGKKKRRRRRSGATGHVAEKPAPGRTELQPKASRREGPKPFFKKPAVVVIAAALVVAAGAFLLLRRSDRVAVKRESGLNVLLITLDTTRADRLGCYGY
ncbi:MAG: hypothetical protein OEW05_11035, partial [Candidatus Aminicenantes bacterium]|nr:hypothetical protein [Candidatus Aminicenantes bacterium]